MIKMLKSGDHYITVDISIKTNSTLNIVIAHGAKNDMNYTLIKQLFELLRLKYSVIKFNFSYVDNNLKLDENINKEEIETCIKFLGNKNIVLIGKSYGGFLSTIIASENKFDIVKVIVLGYPLHEPNRPGNVYSQKHLKNNKLPVCFINGDSDENCNLDIFQHMLPNYEIEIIKNANHSFKPISKMTSIEQNEKEVIDKIYIIIKNLNSVDK